ncbi:MAG: hypothetical protein U5N21_12005 [Rhodococcus sp. (in: high G+C Gram-positive bacteria)]|nr:hypothetical protein [Rhodococcus sp. (in: high G+C Gram-positive bacteria)]
MRAISVAASRKPAARVSLFLSPRAREIRSTNRAMGRFVGVI